MPGTVRRLARNLGVDISSDNTNWLTVPGRVDNAPAFTPTKADSTDVDSGGFKSITVTDMAWTVVIKYNRLSVGGTPNAVQQMIEATEGQFGDSGELYVRWYETDGGTYAKSGRAVVTIVRSKTGEPDLSEITATFDGDGAASTISNPYAPAKAPVVLSATLSGAAAGAQVTILGQFFTGVVPASGVKFGAVTATVTSVVSDGTIVAVMPAGSAGSAPVTVTNATGASNALPYTRA
ncbi:IPT/TIG domain-containing protein [Jatrophihabitans sp. GAS493]|uniref:phage tail tube protein n=1 Tax=Jatrophihabitans sp. GAS493 TaxID=1907575 RepID=UPI000BB829E9|nr:IPT/TIG domain-containing protein [Jatrophihabitans sp. GAS493]SOD72720.1 IPT/TIG domain-containing protein [Jatrophihabitans sp. GAS493]